MAARARRYRVACAAARSCSRVLHAAQRLGRCRRRAVSRRRETRPAGAARPAGRGPVPAARRGGRQCPETGAERGSGHDSGSVAQPVVGRSVGQGAAHRVVEADPAGGRVGQVAVEVVLRAATSCTRLPTRGLATPAWTGVTRPTQWLASPGVRTGRVTMTRRRNPVTARTAEASRGRSSPRARRCRRSGSRRRAGSPRPPGAQDVADGDRLDAAPEPLRGDHRR